MEQQQARVDSPYRRAIRGIAHAVGLRVVAERSWFGTSTIGVWLWVAKVEEKIQELKVRGEWDYPQGVPDTSTVKRRINYLADPVWLDEGTSYLITRPAVDFPSTVERYASAFPNGTISAGLTINPAFYHQYSQAVAVTINCQKGATCTTYPSLQYMAFGSQQVQSTTSNVLAVWADPGYYLNVSASISDFQGNSYATSPSSWLVSAADVVTDPIVYSVSSPSSTGGGTGGCCGGYTPPVSTSTATQSQASSTPIPVNQFAYAVISIVAVFTVTYLVMSRRTIETDAQRVSRSIGAPLHLGSLDPRRKKKKGADKRVSKDVGRLVSLGQLNVKMTPIKDGAQRVSAGIGKRVNLRQVDLRRRKKK
jgi:hypothetical protein